ncbi:hypothetical protein [Chitinophaga filiformis]|uniref:Pectate lyase superfamily protein n=1 Tax=Chitinophaga filiformis TaxID=104663 RepID=A0A1G7MZA3_CHIFI|nr:hypothetical protein [Chitinophaga filiformis]SDF66400.1 hypothetical protein SAMN04488121_102589 [Chitinophaga filiformis]
MVFASISDMKANQGTHDPTATLLGYYTASDGGGGEFYWDSTSQDTENCGTIIKETNTSVGRWKRIITDTVNVRWFGAKGDDTDDTTPISKCAKFCRDNNRNMYFPEGTYYTGTIDITGIYNVSGANMNTRLRGMPGQDILYWKSPTETGFVDALDIQICNFQLKLDRSTDVRLINGRTRIGLGGEIVGNAAICLPGQVGGTARNTGHYFDNLSIQRLGDDKDGYGDCGIFYAGPAYRINFGSIVEVRGLDYGIVVGTSELVAGMKPLKAAPPGTGSTTILNCANTGLIFANGEQVALIFDPADGAVTGLIPRTRYFIVNATTTSVQLAATSGGTAISFSTSNPNLFLVPAGANCIEYACDEWAAEHLITALSRRVGLSVPNLAQSVFNTFGCQSYKVAVRVMAFPSAVRYEPRSVEFSEMYTEGPLNSAVVNQEYALIEGTQIRVANGPKCQNGGNGRNNFITINTNYSDFGLIEVDDGNRVTVNGDGNTIRAGVQSKENFIDDFGVNNSILFIKSFNGLDAPRDITYLAKYSVNRSLGGYWPDHVLQGTPEIPFQSENVLFHLAVNQLFYNNPSLTYKTDATLDVNAYVSTSTAVQLAIRNPLGSVSNTFSINRFFPKSRWILYAKVKSPDVTKNVTIAFQRLDVPGSFGASRVVTNVGTSWQTISLLVDHSGAPDGMTGQIYVTPASGGLDLAYFVVVPATMQSLRTGSFTATGDGNATTFTIPHGMGLAAAPSYFQVNAASANAKNISYLTADASGIIVHYDTAPANGANLVFTWAARI